MSTFASLPTPPIHNIPSLIHVSETFLTNITNTCDRYLEWTQPHQHWGVPWWNNACCLAVGLVHTTTGQEHKHAVSDLHRCLCDAKCSWYEECLTDPDMNVWDFAKWRKGWQRNWINALSLEGGPTDDSALMMEAFCERFFNLEEFSPSVYPPAINNRVLRHSSSPKTWDPLTGCNFLSDGSTLLFLVGEGQWEGNFPKQPYCKLLHEEIATTLEGISSSSALGPSEINYSLLKWSWEANPSYLHSILSHALSLGHHPWPNANVVIIPNLTNPLMMSQKLVDQFPSLKAPVKY